VAIAVLKDLRLALGPARDQGSRPTCVAFAVSDAHAVARGAYETLSAEHLYYHGVNRTPGGNPYSGVTLTAVLEGLHHDGQCWEVGWPYLDCLPADLKLWRPPATATPVYRRGTTPVASAIDDLIATIDAGMPVILTLLLGLRFHTPASGVVEPGPGDVDTDYHAVLAVGHGREGTRRYILVRNSWGNGWGLDGHAWIAADYLEPRLYQVALMGSI
jgi:hypothetical protein